MIKFSIISFYQNSQKIVFFFFKLIITTPNLILFILCLPTAFCSFYYVQKIYAIYVDKNQHTHVVVVVVVLKLSDVKKNLLIFFKKMVNYIIPSFINEWCKFH